MPNQRRQALTYLYLSSTLLACNGLFAKGIPLDSVSMSAVRSVIAAAGLFLFYRFRTRFYSPPSKEDLIKTTLLGLMLGLHWVTFFGAMQASTVAIGMISLFSYPVITVILEPALDRKLPKLKDLGAGFLVLVGIAIMMPEQNNNGWQLNPAAATGVGLGLCSAFLFSLRNSLQHRVLHHMQAGQSTLYQIIVVGVVLSPFINWGSIEALQPTHIGQLFILGIVTTAIAHSFLVASLRNLPAKSVSMIGCVQPPIAALLAWLVLHEQPAMQVIMGGAIVLSVALYETWKSR